MTAYQNLEGSVIESWVVDTTKPLSIKINNDELRLDAVLRHLPNKRLTCLAKWQNKKVIAKCFYGSGFQKHTEHEKTILNALIKSGINTPTMLHSHEQGDCAVLLIEYIEKSVSMLDWLKDEPDQSEFDAVISEATDLLFACHKAGFEIHDPHSDNFLISHDKVYLIDAGDISQSSSALSDEVSIQNMALLYAQLPVTYDLIAYQAIEKLLKNHNIEIGFDEKSWRKRLIKQRHWRQKKFIDKKVFRECSAYTCESNWYKFLVAKRNVYSDELAKVMANPDALIEKGVLLKDGNTATVSRVEIAGKSYVLKRYNVKKPVHALVRGFRWSRAAVSWRNGLLLEMLGIPTPKSYVLVEERWGAVRRRSYLLSEFIDAPQAWDVFKDNEFSEKDKNEWAKKIYDLFLLLERGEISHGDLKAQNILCPPCGPMFIDLDGMQPNQPYNKFLRQFKKDVKRFLISWPLKWSSNPYFGDYFK